MFTGKVKPFNMKYAVFGLALVVLLAIQVTPARSFNLGQFQWESLDSHNQYRRKHGCPDLQLSSTVTSVAQDWANKLASEDKMYHRPNNKYGENIFWVSAGDPDGTIATSAFYSEIQYYNFDKPGFSYSTGHFTALLWRASKNLGIGIAKSKKGGTYVVANYDPPGNYLGQFEENVPRPIY